MNQGLLHCRRVFLPLTTGEAAVLVSIILPHSPGVSALILRAFLQLPEQPVPPTTEPRQGARLSHCPTSLDSSILQLTGFPSGSAVKNPPAMQEMQETPDSLHATRSQRVGHDPTQPRDPASVYCIAGRSSLSKPPGKPLLNLTIC